jgi:hypothetical protein
LFDSGKSFKKETYPTLVSITEILKEYPYSRFLVEGHTDSDGSNEMNKLYLKTELQRLKNYLIENGIKADRLILLVLVKLNQWTLTKLLQEKHTTEELKFHKRINFSKYLQKTSRFIGFFYLTFFLFNIYILCRN